MNLIYFNIKGGKEIEEITFEDTITALETVKGVQTRSDPSRQIKITGNIARYFYLRSEG